ncbi:MAG: nitrophenyl compound nitroreductase subunit ArsF family protein [Bacteroidales bacterium]|jgi:hypothetical protein|nr:nitrophenyl compound nitroreductase subunit ArsF family protein [Bacteroidales bacterium]
MKKLTFILILFFVSLHGYGQSSGDTIISNNPQNLKVRVLYFHITNRCNTCYSIEKYVKQTIDTNFAEQLELGIIDLYVLNCEQAENKELVKKYDAYGATLAITYYINGKEDKTEDLSNWAFQKVHKPETFMEELKSKINESIK